MQLHPLAKIFWAKLIRFGQTWLDLGKIETKFGRRRSEIWAKSKSCIL